MQRLTTDYSTFNGKRIKTDHRNSAQRRRDRQRKQRREKRAMLANIANNNLNPHS